jgi:pyruvate/2-oxoacid:ferredoxin oxidoreductase alpha subunit
MILFSWRAAFQAVYEMGRASTSLALAAGAPFLCAISSFSLSHDHPREKIDIIKQREEKKGALRGRERESDTMSTRIRPRLISMS